MGKYKRYKNSIEKFLSSDKGQRFFNFAYSIGAAIVIWGALFKILHLPGGSLLLSIGMGTEVLMFILSAFDTPPKTYHWEEVFPVLNSKNPEDRPEFSGGKGTVIIGGNGKGGGSNGGNYSDITPSDAKRAVGIPEGLNLSDADTQSLTDSIQKMSAAADQLSRMAELTDANPTIPHPTLRYSRTDGTIKKCDREPHRRIEHPLAILPQHHGKLRRNIRHLARICFGYGNAQP